MEAQIQVFQHEMFGSLRTLRKDQQGEPWFVAKDVCGCLDIRTNDALNSLDDDEKGYDTVVSLGGPQQMAFVSEPGLYSLVLRSRKPEAKAFKRWVTHDILPSIRKSGGYMAAKPTTRRKPSSPAPCSSRRTPSGASKPNATRPSAPRHGSQQARGVRAGDRRFRHTPRQGP